MAGINLRRSLFGGNDIAIDLGTANTLIYVKGVGVMVDEPTLIAVNKEDGSILTVGEEAKKLVGRVPDSIKLVKPLRDGVISEIEMAEELVKTLLTRAIGRSYSRPRIVTSWEELINMNIFSPKTNPKIDTTPEIIIE